ncbi:MAG TPA: UDP-3-O-(3-hydroxymyristoyl)glucosamine N-acyltransferase [Candidatus Aphodousia gallistercoris]|nr:UDP-3-O-(3-hydroxymyristoyl)glucosamine N-acyltransferase [Candidatus Aphodousia gallistercoris]
MDTQQFYPIAMLVEAVRRQSGGRLKAELIGPYEGVCVNNIGTLSHATPDEVAFLANPKFIHEVKDCRAGVIVLREEDKKAIYGDETPRAMVITPNPYAWFAYALQVVVAQQDTFASGVNLRASVAVTAHVDPTARIDAGAIVEDHAVIGKHAWIGANAVVGVGASIGDNTRLHPNVTVNYGCHVGARCILHSGCVIGADGFGFAPFDGEWVKIPQIGAVRIEDDVEIGANTCVDRGALEDTVIGQGTKLDNLIQIGHNTRIGKHCVMAGSVTVAGSVNMGDHVIVGGSSNINGHITIPSDVTVGPATQLMSFPKNQKLMMGFFPAMPNRDFERSAVLIMHLPEMRKRLKALESAVSQLQEKTTKED